MRCEFWKYRRYLVSVTAFPAPGRNCYNEIYGSTGGSQHRLVEETANRGCDSRNKGTRPCGQSASKRSKTAKLSRGAWLCSNSNRIRSRNASRNGFIQSTKNH
ncbi:hypothetical protein RRG08_042594 [Elysia crispata]|uniref:Uncharacterized protein n=1 Tax=Elysia crispata TaxID=231223 RepID=A0AAE0XR93_9GAST|nr:hypothetical protein RRG08_042594 [Elysia crispata]